MFYDALSLINEVKIISSDRAFYESMNHFIAITIADESRYTKTTLKYFSRKFEYTNLNFPPHELPFQLIAVEMEFTGPFVAFNDSWRLKRITFSWQMRPNA